MKIAAALVWYDEPPASLDRCVRSLGGVVDELVAVDGRWELFADDRPILSDWRQAQAIGRAADAVGLEHAVWMGPSVWPSQVAKRAATMALASEQNDWVFVIDADEWVTNCDRIELGLKLAGTTLDVGTVLSMRLDERRAPAKFRRVFRQGTTVMTAHNGYNLGGRWLHGDVAHVKLEEAVDVSRELQIHTSGATDDRLELKRAYYQARHRNRVEAWR